MAVDYEDIKARVFGLALTHAPAEEGKERLTSAVSLDSTLTELNIKDSFDLIELGLELEDNFGITIPEFDFCKGRPDYSETSLRQVVNYVCGRIEEVQARARAQPVRT